MGLNIPLKTSGGASIMDEAMFYFFAMWALLFFAVIVITFIERSRLGFGLACIRQNESAADMIGVNGTLYKSLAFAFSGAFVAMAGPLVIGRARCLERGCR